MGYNYEELTLRSNQGHARASTAADFAPLLICMQPRPSSFAAIGPSAGWSCSKGVCDFGSWRCCINSDWWAFGRRKHGQRRAPPFRSGRVSLGWVQRVIVTTWYTRTCADALAHGESHSVHCVSFVNLPRRLTAQRSHLYVVAWNKIDSPWATALSVRALRES